MIPADVDGESAAYVLRILSTPSTSSQGNANVFRFMHNCHEKYWPKGDRPKRTMDKNLNNIPEIFQTNEVVAVTADEVHDLAFVFSEDVMRNLPFHAQGMSNLFMLRHRIGGIIPEGHCRPFHSSYKIESSKFQIQCFPSLVWNSLKRLRIDLLKPLSRRGQAQGGLVRA